MYAQLMRRIAAPLVVLAGAALFGIGAGGISAVDARLEAAARPAAQPQRQQQAPDPDPWRRGVRDDRPHPHRGEL
jgi:hypothetical protein